jgi:S1-C subfamily serine protease
MDVPVLFFFTGLHSDYHKPTDDFDKINYNGELLVIRCIENLITAANSKGRLAFSKTRETQTSSSARFSVSLGIMPDYTFTGAGVRADGVSDNRPAQKAGIKAGDVIIQLGDHSITSMEGYMQALSKFKKGDSTKVKYKRGNDILEADVTF